jgi:hypothetical protein
MSLRGRVGCTNSVGNWISPICSEIVFVRPTGTDPAQTHVEPLAELTAQTTRRPVRIGRIGDAASRRFRQHRRCQN